MEKVREELAKTYGLGCGNDVRCYHCKRWGYNLGKSMSPIGTSRCYNCENGEKTASFQWCKSFEYVGNKA